MRHARAVAALCVVVMAALVASCARDERAAGCAPRAPQRLLPDVVRELAHPNDAYTQGLVVHDGALYESTGLVGESTLRELDPDTGQEVRRTDVDPAVFGEGLAVGHDGRLVQLTWKDGVAYEWDAATFTEVRRFSYRGEGWGLTTLDDGTLVMSDGSDRLVERNPDDFAVTDSYTVRRKDGPADSLNELEWDGEHLWANRYRTDEVLRIDAACATVTGVLDISQLTRAAGERVRPGDPELGVGNGIAHLPGTDRYLLTGKNWPVMFEVTLAEA